MPTYEYACSACGNEWEQTQRIIEAPIDVCPRCGKSTAHRLISRGTNFILKGGGWYSDLYASPKPSAEAGKPSTEGAEKKSENDTKGEKPSSGTGPSGSPEPSAKPAAKPAAAESATSSSAKSSGTSPGPSSAPTN